MKTIKIFTSFLLSLAVALLIGVAASMVAPVDPVAVGATFFIVKTLYFFVVDFKLETLFMAGVNKEIWIDKLKENFYSNYDWLSGVDDWSEFVEYNTINFTAVGADPVILKNNASWPIVAVQRTDTNSTVVLDTYDSTTTRVYNVEEIEASINKLESVVRQHRRSLIQAVVTECLINYSPATLALGAVAATGSNRPVVIGAQSTVAARLTLNDLAAAQTRLDSIDAPLEGRCVVLNPYHREDLLIEDKSLFKQFGDQKKGEIFNLYGFEVYTAKNTPLYAKSTLVRKVSGAAADNTNDCIASSIFLKSEVMKCMGEVEMFYKEKGINPEQRADEVGFQMRFKGLPQRITTANVQQAIVSSRA